MRIWIDENFRKEWKSSIAGGQMLPAPNTFEPAPTQFQNSENTFYSGNKSPELKIMYSGKINPEEIFVFRI